MLVRTRAGTYPVHGGPVDGGQTKICVVRVQHFVPEGWNKQGPKRTHHHHACPKGDLEEVVAGWGELGCGKGWTTVGSGGEGMKNAEEAG